MYHFQTYRHNSAGDGKGGKGGGGKLLHELALRSVRVVPCVTHGEGICVSAKAVSLVHSDVDGRRHDCGMSRERR
jgi:hypothetical protein